MGSEKPRSVDVCGELSKVGHSVILTYRRRNAARAQGSDINSRRFREHAQARRFRVSDGVAIPGRFDSPGNMVRRDKASRHSGFCFSPLNLTSWEAWGTVGQHRNRRSNVRQIRLGFRTYWAVSYTHLTLPTKR